METISKVITIINVIKDLPRTPNRTIQLLNFLFILITLKCCSKHNNIAIFQNNKISGIVDTLGVSCAKIFDKNCKNRGGKIIRRGGKF